MYFYASIGNSSLFIPPPIRFAVIIPQVFLSILLYSRKDTFLSSELKVLLNYDDPTSSVNNLRHAF